MSWLKEREVKAINSILFNELELLICFHFFSFPAALSFRNWKMFSLRKKSKAAINGIDWFVLWAGEPASPALSAPIPFNSAKAAGIELELAWLAALRSSLGPRLFDSFLLRRKQKKVNFHLCCCRRNQTALSLLPSSFIEFHLLLSSRSLLLAEPHAACGGHNPPIKERRRSKFHSNSGRARRQ